MPLTKGDVMDERNQQVLAAAFRNARYKNEKIKLWNIRQDMPKDEIEELIEVGARDKAGVTGKDWKTHIKGQRWYIESLIAFDAMTQKEKLDHEYSESFPDLATEEEMLKAL